SAQVLQPAADVFGKSGFEPAPVEPFQGHFALVGQNDLFHIHSFRSFVQICCRSRRPASSAVSSASTSASSLSAQKLTRSAVATARSSQPMACSVWLGSPLSQALPPDT